MPSLSTSSSKTDRQELARVIALVGMPGAGKTSVGRLLAARLNIPFVDSDEAIERAEGASIAQLFDRNGEAGFRALERATIDRLLDGTPRILATGGGAMADEAARALLLARAVTVWLDAPVAVLAGRLEVSSHRPLLRSAPARNLAALLARRAQCYALAAHRFDATRTPEQVAAAIASMFDARPLTAGRPPAAPAR